MKFKKVFTQKGKPLVRCTMTPDEYHLMYEAVTVLQDILHEVNIPYAIDKKGIAVALYDFRDGAYL